MGDLWEANMWATAFTPHPASNPGLTVCTGDDECGRQDGDRFKAPTDRDGCDINAYRLGHHNFYGPGSDFQVNTQQPFTVVTRFHAPSGDLIGIEQFYVQNGQEIHHPNSVGLHNKNIETDETCADQKKGFCDPKDGAPEILREDHPDSKYTITNLRWGEFGSTSVSAADVTV